MLEILCQLRRVSDRRFVYLTKQYGNESTESGSIRGGISAARPMSRRRLDILSPTALVAVVTSLQPDFDYHRRCWNKGNQTAVEFGYPDCRFVRAVRGRVQVIDRSSRLSAGCQTLADADDIPRLTGDLVRDIVLAGKRIGA